MLCFVPARPHCTRVCVQVVSSPAGDLPLVRMWCKEAEGEEQDVSALMCAQPEAFGLVMCTDKHIGLCQ